MPPRLLLPIAMACTAAVTAQDWRPLDGPHRMITGAFDAHRGRVVTVASGRETREWDGQHWLHRPLPLLPSLPSCMAFDEQRGALVAIVMPPLTSPPPTLRTWEGDGTSWVLRTPATAPSFLLSGSCVYHSATGKTLFVASDSPGGTFSTWLWTGQNWFQATTPPTLTGRLHAALAYDAARARTVMFGGLGAGGSFGSPLAQTWEWDGAVWILRTPATSPSARAGAAMAYDAARQVCVLFGGTSVADTWEYDGVTWVQRTGPMPAARSLPGLVHDRHRGRTVLFGGTSASGYLQDVWEWDGAAWTQRLADVQPAFRVAPGLAYSATRDRVVLFGGEDGTGTGNSTWEWDGDSWSRIPLSPAQSPPGRSSHAMWSDGNDVFVFGGKPPGSSGQSLNDTWRWDGLAWSVGATGPAPSVRASAAATIDPTNGGALLFGGVTGSNPGTFSGDTWRLQGTGWTQLAVTPSPAPRAGAGIATDPVRQRIVMWGGVGPASTFDDTWEWDGTSWLLQNPLHRPPATGIQSMAYEPTLGAVVLLTRPSFVAETLETWLWIGGDWLRLDTPTRLGNTSVLRVVAQPGRVLAHDGEHLYALTAQPPLARGYATGCPAAAQRLTADTWPRPGATDFALTSSGSTANAPVLFVVGVAVAALPIGGCLLLVQPGGPLAASVADAQGICTLPVPLIATPALVGLRAFAQAWSLAPGGLAATNGLDLTIGQ